MKIKLFLLLILAIPFLILAETAPCQEPQGNFVGTFWAWFNYHICEEWTPLQEEATEAIKSLRENSGESATLKIQEVGNVFCRWLYGPCDETSLSTRFEAACETARIKTLTSLAEHGVDLVNSTTHLLSDSLLRDSGSLCITRANMLISAYKDAAGIQATAWNSEQKQASDNKYLSENLEKSNTLIDIMATVKKKMINFVRSFQGFTRLVFE